MSKQIKADIILLLITIVWGSSFPLMKNVLDHLPAFAYLSVRFFMAALVLAVIFFRHFRNLNGKVLLYGCIIGMTMFAGMALQVNGLYTTTASNSGFITGLNVVMVPVISAWLLKKKPDKSSTIGVATAFIGLFFLTGGVNFRFNLGDFLTFLCSICWAFQIILVDKFTNEQDPALLGIVQISFTSLASTAVWLTVDYKPLAFNSTVIVILLITGLLGTAFAFGGQTIVQKDTSPTHTALIFTAEPVFAGIFSMLIPNSQGKTETLGPVTIIGCVLILAGMLIAELRIGEKGSRLKSGI